MRDLILFATYLTFFIYGAATPFIFLLGYVWIDILAPQTFAYGFFTSIPVSLIIGVATLLSVLIIRRTENNRIPLPLSSKLILLFAAWMTITLFWSEVPTNAYIKWSSSFKTMLVASIVPLIILEIIQLESLIWIIVISGIAHCIPVALKVIISGGGYGAALGLVQSNSGYGEGSTLAMLSVSLIPWCLFLIKHGTLLGSGKLSKIVLFGFILSAILASLGTFARTGLVSLGALGLGLIIFSRRKLLYFAIALFVGFILFNFTDTMWQERMSSISNSSESSAMGRVAVWMWTLEYITRHPWGGGFGVYLISEYILPLADGSFLSVKAKAFHSIYFEVLGEMGVPGALIFFFISTSTLSLLFKTRDLGKNNKNAMIFDFSTSMLLSLIVYYVGGAFIGVAFQSYFYYLAGMTTAAYRLANIESRGENSKFHSN